MPSSYLNIHSTLATTLFDLLIFRSGRSFGARGTHVGDWTNTVWDLIEVALTKAFTRKATGRVGVSRHAGDQLALDDGSTVVAVESNSLLEAVEEAIGRDRAAHLLGATDRRKIPPLASDGIEDDESGASLVLIETREVAE